MPKEANKSVQILSENLFPVVGVGASAEGLEAFEELVKALLNIPHATFLFQHLSPKYESLLVEILQKITKIPVVEITNNLKVTPDHFLSLFLPIKMLTVN